MPNTNERYLKGNARGYGTESLPNIKGVFYGERVALTAGLNSGVFYEGNNPYGGYGASPYSYNNQMQFDASRSSSAYQDGAKVNPDHVYVNFIIKY